MEIMWVNTTEQTTDWSEKIVICMTRNNQSCLVIKSHVRFSTRFGSAVFCHVATIKNTMPCPQSSPLFQSMCHV